jgi:hypothetical protein
MAHRPEEVDAAQEADEQRGIAQRGEGPADIGDQNDEEDDHMRVARPSRVRPDQRANKDHRRAGGADDARDRGSEGHQGGVDDWRAAHRAGDKDTARDRVEREQEQDEAQIFDQHRVQESGDHHRHAVEQSDRHERQHGPAGRDLAVVVMP